MVLRCRLPRGAQLTAALAAMSAMVALVATSDASAARPSVGKVDVTITAPTGVPANVTLRGSGKRVVTKAPAGRSARSKLAVPTGRVRVKAKRITFDGAVYRASISRRRIKVRKGRTVKVRVAYAPLAVAKRLHATAVAADSVSLAWSASRSARVQLRRSAGERPARTVRQGTAVKTNRGAAVDQGLQPGTTYSYALFTRVRKRWVGPVTITAGTAADDPSVAAYVAPPSTVIVEPGDADVPTATATGVSVRLAPKRPTPIIGAGFVLPVSAALPGGYLGTVTSIAPGGRTVELAAAGLADAFDFYEIDVDLAAIDPVELQPSAEDAPAPAPRAGLAAGLKHCGGGSGGSVALHPVIKPRGHFGGSIVKKWGAIPVGAKFDLSAELEIGMSADLEVDVGLSCGLPFKKVVWNITVAPVPIALVFDPVAEVRVAGQMSAENVGYTVTGGFWTKGEIGSNNWVDGGLIARGGPTPSRGSWSVPVTISLGGELTVGPGGGSPGAGAAAGVGGKYIPVKGSFGPVFPVGDPRRDGCIKTSVGYEAELNLNAKAWVGNWSLSRSITLDALKKTGDYGGGPWYLPSDCEKQPDTSNPSSAVLGDGVQEVSSSTTGEAEQWGHVDGFAPGSKAWILGTGRIDEASINDPSFHASTELFGEGNPRLSELVGGAETFDGASYRVVLKPTGDMLHVRYLFASEEYPEYVGEGYDDVMAVFVDGTNCAHVPGTGDRVSVDSVNAWTNSQYFVDNADGAAGYSTSMDGVTVPLTCDVPVTPGREVTVEIAVADTGDGVYDSAVGMLDRGIWSD